MVTSYHGTGVTLLAQLGLIGTETHGSRIITAFLVFLAVFICSTESAFVQATQILDANWSVWCGKESSACQVFRPVTVIQCQAATLANLSWVGLSVEWSSHGQESNQRHYAIGKHVFATNRICVWRRSWRELEKKIT